MTEFLVPFLEATVRSATPLALAAVGETLTERAGVINVGLEGAIMAGCFGALAASTGSLMAGVAGGVAGGVLVGVILAAFVIGLRADQIITGTALTLGAYGATGALYRVVFGEGGVALSIPTMRPMALPFLADLPLVGPVLFTQPLVTYLAFALAPVLSWWLYRTHTGLGLRAIGEQPSAAIAAGIRVSWWQAAAIVGGAALGGLAGASLVLAQAGTFSEQMSAGRGFIAIAIVALGRWTPLGALGAALLFGAASALQYRFQALGSGLPYQLFLVLPYLLTLLVLAGGFGRARAPGALARPLPVNGD
jgi:simple sugar transport system permease protein